MDLSQALLPASPSGEARRSARDAAEPLDAHACVLLGRDARIQQAGPTAAALLGFQPAELVGRSLVELAAPGWREAAEVAAQRIRFGAHDAFELMLRGRSGRLTLIEMSVRRPAQDAGDERAFMVGWTNRWLRREALQTSAEEEARRLARELMQVREEEHLNLARLLQDDLSERLVLTRLRIEAARKQEQQPASDLLAQAAESLRGVAAELQTIALALRPRLLIDLGLSATLEWHCRAFQQAHPPLEVIRVLTASEESIPPALKIEIFRIVQDAFSNVARHAQASAVRLELTEEGGELRLTIEDNGRGFDPAAALRCGRTRLGLPSIRKRIDSTGGRMVLDSVPRRGTRVGGVWWVHAAPAQEKGEPAYYQKGAVEGPIRT